MDFSLHTYNYYRVVKNPFGEVDTLFQILVWWVTMSDRPFSVSGHHPLYSKMLRECPSIFSAECDATLHDSCLDRTFFVSSVQNRCGRDGIISCFQETVLLTFIPKYICPLGKIPICPQLWKSPQQKVGTAIWQVAGACGNYDSCENNLKSEVFLPFLKKTGLTC